MSQINKSAILAAFIKIFDRLVKSGDTLNYRPEWANDTGYFNNALEGDFAIKLQSIGYMRCFMDDKNRRAIAISTPVGNVIVFERYPNEDANELSDGQKFVYQAPSALNAVGIVHATVGDVDTEALMIVLVGNYIEGNVGVKLLELKRLLDEVK